MDKLFTMPHPLYKLGDIVVAGMDEGYLQAEIMGAIFSTKKKNWYYRIKGDLVAESNILYKL
jgi:hypothetical protein